LIEQNESRNASSSLRFADCDMTLAKATRYLGHLQTETLAGLCPRASLHGGRASPPSAGALAVRWAAAVWWATDVVQ
jgi:hypothetical protein